MPDTENKDYRLVSNSESQAYNTCQRRYYYEYDLKLAPNTYKGALGVGIIGHELLEIILQAEKIGLPYESVAELLAARFSQMYADDSYDKESLFKANELVVNYDSIFHNSDQEYGPQSREILAVEENYYIRIAEEDSTRIYMPFKVDALIKDTVTGEVQAWDHKFVYDFYSHQKIQLSPQFQKYLFGLQIATEFTPTVLRINQIRTRNIKIPTKEQLYNRADIEFNYNVARQMMVEHINTAIEIVSWKELSLQQRGEAARRIYNPMVCGNCPFAELCISDLTGGHSDAIIENSYRTNEYGYKNIPEEVINGDI